jgi:DNA polymerase alpha subunit A
MADRARRERTNKADKFAELKRARAGGRRTYQERDSKIYDEVTEDQYKVPPFCEARRIFSN